MAEETVDCATHGQRPATFVCQHLANGTGLMWFSAGPPTEATPCPDSWCEKCDSQRLLGGGAWTEASQAFAQINVLCSDCYHDRRAALASEVIDDTDIELQYKCGQCEEVHLGLPGWSDAAPVPYYAIAEAERDKRAVLTEDTCIIDGEYYFLRGNIELPIREHRARFIFGVWVSLSRESFERVGQLWQAAERVCEEPCFGWLSSALPDDLFPETMLLKAHVFQRPVGTRPLVSLEPTDHPLAVAQRSGIDAGEARRLAHSLLAKHGGGVL